MLISLDYDGTFTNDPAFWLEFIAAAKNKGHRVICITMRAAVPCEADPVRFQLGSSVDDILFTDCKAKRKFAVAAGYNIDVWIDDQPSAVENDFYRNPC